MSSVEQHYDTLLAPIYLWMAGGIENALVLGASDVADCGKQGGLAVDLGAGFGMHAIPLARMGYRVVAVDSSAFLLEQLRSFGEGLPIKTVAGNLLQFPKHIAADQKADLIVCMGDTLTHLPNREDVASLARLAGTSLAPGGRFVATFRNYVDLPIGDKRFIPVRSDASRIHTCFIEEAGDAVCVHDILHEKQDDKWSMRVSSYKKLRLAPESVREDFAEAGLAATVGAGPRGMVKLVAEAR